ncbi:hypothetical protein BF93_13220 [Brachybacterium phenoliresistens]|uniref:PASTA domain-containing protein n=2 Tax=Brachybacterium phenoliresistens TaxID=396014 RepID=Z9JMB7_9MICO|nr:hypothetical protein BF93_13220 [Brachybacterium phenoliresistens]
MRRIVMAAAILGASLVVVACGPSTRDLPAQDAVGTPMSTVDEHISPGARVSIVDLSAEFDLEPSFTDAQRTSDRWMVLAVCSDHETIDGSTEIQLAVAPRDAVPEGGPARSDEFADAVHCG